METLLPENITDITEQNETEPAENKEALPAFFADWLENGDDSSIPDWDDLPDIDLYMDQVIKYMRNQLERSNISENEKNITSSMINNYTKEGLLDRPERKRYNKKHLASLMMVCLLKQVMPMLSIKQLFEYLNDTPQSYADVYSAFYGSQRQAFEQTAEYANSVLSADCSNEEKCILAVELASKSNALRIAAQRLIASLKEKN